MRLVVRMSRFVLTNLLEAPEACSLLRFASVPGVCDLCGSRLTGRQQRWCGRGCSVKWLQQHRWSWARREAKKRDRHRCTREGCQETERLEVNHITPRLGQGYGTGCWNHLGGLETLCHRHHLEVTAQQRRERL